MSSPHRLLLAALLVLCAAPVSARQTETGFASWYNRGFDGLQTANGETYDHEALTAAHRSLPFGTFLRVTRLDTGASVIVRVNDRMPPEPGHLVDLSGAAAQRLDLLRIGVSRVRLEVVSPTVAQAESYRAPVQNASVGTATPRPAGAASPVQYVPPAQLASGTFTLQIGAYQRRDTAELMATQYEHAYIVPSGPAERPLFRVYFGAFRDEATARVEQSRLWDQGQDSFLRRL